MNLNLGAFKVMSALMLIHILKEYQINFFDLGGSILKWIKPNCLFYLDGSNCIQ